MAINLTSFDPILKELYVGQKVKDLVYPKNPFFAMIGKYENFEGDLYPLPLKSENNQSVSATFAVGAAIGGNSEYKRFGLTRSKKYGFAEVDGETARASKSDKGAFLAALRSEIDSTKKAVADSISADIFAGKDGELGGVNSIDTAAITLGSSSTALPNEITKFHVGMDIVIYDTTNMTKRTGGKSVGGVTNVFTISSRNADTGVITLDATPASVVAGDILFRAGDRGNSLSGLDAWLTADSTALAASFFGVVRSVDPSRLAGVHYTAASSEKIETSLINAVSKCNREGGRPDMLWMAFEDFAALVVELGAKVVYERKIPSDASKGFIGFQALKLHTAFGLIDVMADQHCARKVVYGLDMSSWKLYSLGTVPMIDDLDGNSLLRSGTADAVIARIISYHQLGCNAPGHNVRIILD